MAAMRQSNVKLHGLWRGRRNSPREGPRKAVVADVWAVLCSLCLVPRACLETAARFRTPSTSDRWWSGAKSCTRRNGYDTRMDSPNGYRGTTTRGRRCGTTHLFALSILVHSAHALYPSKLLIQSTDTCCAIYIYNPWMQEVCARLNHVSQQACCDCGMNLGEFKARSAYLAERRRQTS
jgi:hypothetical protein